MTGTLTALDTQLFEPAEFERSLIQERVRAGLRNARAKEIAELLMQTTLRMIQAE